MTTTKPAEDEISSGNSYWDGFKISLSSHKFVEIGEKAVLIGPKFQATRVFDPVAATWKAQEMTNKPDLAPHFAVASLGSIAFVFGGGTGYYFQDIVDCDDMLKLSLDITSPQPLGSMSMWGATGAWSRVEKTIPWPSARYAHGLAAVGEAKLLLFGGSAGGQNRNDLWEFTASSESWRQLYPPPPIPPARRHFGCVVLDNILYIFGGNSESVKDSVNILGDLWAWDGAR